MHDSVLEQRKLIEGIAVRMLGLVLDHDEPKSSCRTSSQLQVPRGGRIPSVLASTQDMPGDPTEAHSPTRSCFFFVVSVAQEAITAIHVGQSTLVLFSP